VGDILTVTISTNQSQPYENAVFTLNINSNVCNNGGGGDKIVSCREEEGNVTHHTTFSYNVTALNPGTANIQGHTLYYGGEWYSTSMAVTIRPCHDTPPKSEYILEFVVDVSTCDTDTTNAIPPNTTDAKSATSPPTSTEQTPPTESGSGEDSYGNESSPNGDAPPSSVRKSSLNLINSLMQ